jgi:hypothetical protein
MMVKKSRVVEESVEESVDADAERKEELDEWQ